MTHKQKNKPGAGRPPVVVLEQYGEIDRWCEWWFKKQRIEPKILQLDRSGVLVEVHGVLYGCSPLHGYPGRDRHVLKRLRWVEERKEAKKRASPLHESIAQMRAAGLHAEADAVVDRWNHAGGMSARHLCRRLTRGVVLPDVFAGESPVMVDDNAADVDAGLSREQALLVEAKIREWWEEARKPERMGAVGMEFHRRAISGITKYPKPPGYNELVSRARAAVLAEMAIQGERPLRSYSDRCNLKGGGA